MTASTTPPHQHALDTTGHCAVCQQAVCIDCATPLPGEQWICQPCYTALHPTAQPLPNKVPLCTPMEPSVLPSGWLTLTTVFCSLLGLIYLVSSFPLLLEAHPRFLDRVSLDLNAIQAHKEYWRLLTANMTHVNLSHLGLNIFSIAIFGSLLERQIPKSVLLVWLLITLIGCDLASLWLRVPNSVGASGIAYGLQTAFIVLTGKVMITNRLQSPLTTLRSLIAYGVLIVLLNMVYTEQINVYGHFGGALTGAIAALIYPTTRPFHMRDGVLLLLFFGAMVFTLAAVAMGPL